VVVEPVISTLLMPKSARGHVCSQLNPPPILTTYIPILTLCSHFLLCLARGRFPEGFSTKILYAFLVSPTLVTCTVHRSLLTVPGGLYIWRISWSPVQQVAILQVTILMSFRRHRIRTVNGL